LEIQGGLHAAYRQKGIIDRMDLRILPGGQPAKLNTLSSQRDIFEGGFILNLKVRDRIHKNIR
jgi:hypothetical protein